MSRTEKAFKKLVPVDVWRNLNDPKYRPFLDAVPREQYPARPEELTRPQVTW